jgi:hypothetical protein
MPIDFKAAYASGEAAVNIVQGILSLKSETAKNQAIIDIQRHVAETQRALIAAEQDNLARLKEVDALETKIGEMENWTAQKQNYELDDTGTGGLAYRLKDGVQPPEKSHWICPQCYEDGKRSIMHPEALPGRCDTLNCNRCGLAIVTRGRRLAESPRVVTGRRSPATAPRF